MYKLDTSNIKTWNPHPEHLEKSLLDSVDHIETGRTEQDILTELLLKQGLELCLPIETRSIGGKSLHSLASGTLMACLHSELSLDDIEEIGRSIIDWHSTSVPERESTVFFLDSAFVDDVAKTNLVSILKQHGIQNIRTI